MTLAEWTERLAHREAVIGIIGLGYVGLPLALLFSAARFRVVGFDIDAEKVARLNRGESYIYRIEAAEIRAAQAAGFRATGDFADVAEVDAILICVPTPLQEDHVPDMTYVVSTMEAIAPRLRAGQIVILESTTYPGTTEEVVVETIERLGSITVERRAVCDEVERQDERQVQREDVRGNGRDASVPGAVLVAFSPEREDPGNTSVPRRDIPKVVGGVGAAATQVACALYRCVFDQTVAMSSPAAAEMTKLLENIYRCVNIALVNEMKQLCERMGIDIWEVIAAAKTKPFGFQAFYPGPGVGGHCIPVDPFYLSWKGAQMGFKTRFIELAGEVNESMPRYVVQAVERALSRGCEVEGTRRDGRSMRGAKILVLGVAYKKDVDDLRESPALTIIEMLRQAGAHVAYNDPFFAHVGRGRRYDLQMDSTPLEALERFDCVVIVTDHTSYDYAELVRNARLVVDSRNATRGIDSPKIVRC